MFPEEKIREQSQNGLDYLINEENCLIYHYTNIDAVKSILNENLIRLASHDSLTDKTEGKYLFDCLVKDYSTEVNIDVLTKLYKDTLENLYICSFCSYGNKESQWQDYGVINIGFDYYFMQQNPPKTIIDRKSIDQNVSAGLQFSPVRYIDESDGEFKNILKNIIDKFGNLTLKEIQSENQFYYHRLTLGVMLFDHKRTMYKDEAEFRIFYYLWKKSPFNNNTKKYINLKFNPQVVKRIVIGPSQNAKNLYIDIKSYIENKSPIYDHVEVINVIPE